MTHSHRPPRRPLVAPGEIEHHVADMTVTASADLTLAQLQQALAEHGQWLPIDGNPAWRLGALVESNSTGPLRLGYGAWRDLLLGSQFTTGSGQLITAGGRTMKNVAGYDLTKFIIGQHRLFATLITFTARTYKRPATALLATFEQNGKLISQLLPTAARPQWAMFAGGFLWCGYLGDERTITFYQSEVQMHRPIELKRQSLQDDIDFRARHWHPDRPALRYRASVPPARVLEFLSQGDQPDAVADAAFGIVVGSCKPDHKDVMRERADALGGTILFDDPEELKAFFSASGAELALLQRLKSAFDA